MKKVLLLSCILFSKLFRLIVQLAKKDQVSTIVVSIFFLFVIQLFFISEYEYTDRYLPYFLSGITFFFLVVFLINRHTSFHISFYYEQTDCDDFIPEEMEMPLCTGFHDAVKKHGYDLACEYYGIEQ